MNKEELLNLLNSLELPKQNIIFYLVDLCCYMD